MEDAVGVHQQGGGGGVDLAVGLEGGVLVGEHLHPGVGHGAGGGGAVQLVGHGAGGAPRPGDVAGPGAQHRAVGALGPAGAEFGHRAALGGPNDAVGLGGDEGLVVQGQQDVGFHKLGLDGGGPDGEDGLPGEDGGALGHGPDVAGKAEVLQILQEFRGEAPLAPEVFDVLLVKAEVLDVVDDLGKPGGDGEAAPVGDAAEEHVKVAHPVLQAGLEVAVAHGQLVEVEQHGVIDVVSHAENPSHCKC